MVVVMVLAACGLSGCSLLRPAAKAGEGPQARKEAPLVARYRLVVEAPRALEALLEQNLDLARFRDAPPGDELGSEEIDRLVTAAPEQARALLATEGYFSPEVTAERRSDDRGLVIVVRATPGPRSTVGSVAIRVRGALQERADAGDAAARALLARLREDWTLKVGDAFRQADWSAAKNDVLGRLQGGGYPAATWLDTDARVQRRAQRVDLEAELQSGPLFRIGRTTVTGLQRYPGSAVRNVSPFSAGTPYSEELLSEFQDRLAKSILFEGGVAEIDPDPANATAAPVSVRVAERPLQQATVGLGYNSNTGTRATLEHIHRRPFGLDWTATNQFELGSQRRAWTFDYRSYPLPGFQRHLVGGNVERWSGDNEERRSGRLRAGRAWENPRLEYKAYGQYDNARVFTPSTGTQSRSQSLTANLDGTRRAVDSLLLPSTGYALVLESALGYARSSTADNGALGRLYARAYWFKPFRRSWHATLRLEAGQVFARSSVGVPDTLLFRAGGDESVRGYDYRSLGPMANGAVTSGRALLTVSAELARPLLERLPDLWGAAFIDAGNAARNFGTLRPFVGVGAGVRYRSPIGPLKVDLAHGLREHQWRLHISAGVSF